MMDQLLKTILTADHYQPHKSAKFEGYYSKFDLPSGARLLMVICTVPNAPRKPHNLTIVYVPKNGIDVWKREFFPDGMEIVSNEKGFTIAATGMQGRLTDTKQAVHYHVECDGIEFTAVSSSRRPWSLSRLDTPAGFLAWLPLPLHWHVHSLASKCQFSLSLPSEAGVLAEDREGEAIVHEEKNWANSFPPAHNWIQGRNQSSYICLAGGRTMGIDAFLVGYRNEKLGVDIDIRPPFAMKICGIAPFMTHRLDWENRTFFLGVQNLWHKLEISAIAPKGTFFCFSSPMSDGFRDNFLGQTMNAEVEVKLYRSTGILFGSWEHICTDRFQPATLEFGAGYYPPRGSGQTIN